METTSDPKSNSVIWMMSLLVSMLVLVELFSPASTQAKESIHGELAVFHKDAYSDTPPDECMARNGADVSITDENGDVLWEDELHIVLDDPIRKPSPACRLAFTSDPLPVTGEEIFISLEGFDTQHLTWVAFENKYAYLEWEEFISK